MFDAFARSAMGTMVVDRQHRIVWISEGYKQFLPALGHAEVDFVGRRVEDVVPNTLMAHVIDTGKPILIDLLTNQAGTFLVEPAAAAQRGRRGDRRLRHGAAGSPRNHDAAAHRQVRPLAEPARRGARPARRRAAAQVHDRRLHRQQPGGARDQAPGAARGAHLEHRAAARRDRHRQGGARAGDPRGEPARGAAVRRHQHRRGARKPARGRVLRRGARRLHGCRPQGPRRQVQARRRRHAVPRRDRRHAARAAEQAAARAAGAGGGAARQQQGAAGRRARDRRHQPRPAGDGGRRQLSRGPLLPPERAADPAAATARAAG